MINRFCLICRYICQSCARDAKVP